MFYKERRIFEFYIQPQLSLNRSKDLRELNSFQGVLNLLKFLLSYYLKRHSNQATSIMPLPSDVPWAIINSRNTEKALETPSSAFKDTKSFFIGYRCSRTTKTNFIDPKTMQKKKFRALWFLLFVIIHPNYSGRAYRKIMRNYHWYDYFVEVFGNHKPRMILLANDHLPYARALALSARKEGIATVYFQHAHVGEDFPTPIFDVSFLYGAASEKIYARKSNDFYSVKIGSFNRCRQLRYDNSDLRIGLAFNPYDDIEAIREQIEYFQNNLGHEVVLLRFHPRFGKHYKEELEIDAEMDFSDRRICEYLSRIQVLISGQSSILLDAALNGVLPILYQPNDQAIGGYDFEKNGLCIKCKNLEEILSAVENKDRFIENIETAAHYYDEGLRCDMSVDDQIGLIRDVISQRFDTF